MTDLIFLLILFVCFAVIAWRSLPGAVALLVFLLPVYQIRFTVFGLPTTALEILFGSLLIVWVIQRIIQGQAAQRPRFPWFWVILPLLVVGLMEVAVSPDHWAGLGLYRAYLLEPALFFFLAADVLQTEADRRRILFAIGTTTILLGLATLLQTTHLVPGVEPYASEHPARATGFFAFPTAIGKFAGPVIAFFLALFVLRKKEGFQTRVRTSLLRGAGGFFFGVVLLGVLALVFSVSRGALLGVFASAVLLVFFSRMRAWMIAALCIVAVLLVAVPITRTKITSVFTRHDVSTDVRLVMWKGTVRLIKDRPIFGAGLAGFPLVYPQYKEASHTEFFPNPDNLLLTLWTELGLFGMLAFLAVLFQFVRRILPLLRATGDPNYPLAVALLAMLVAFFVHGFVDTPYFKNDLALLFWTFAALAESIRRGWTKRLT